MARLSDLELERLKREIAVDRLVEARGVKLRRKGKDLVGLCPFHDDTEPSLVVSPEKNLWHCLGACQTGGSVIDWVMKSEGVSLRHAVELLRQDYALQNSGEAVKRSRKKRLPSPVEATAEDSELLRRVVAFYHETLLASSDAKAYLASRGLASEELVTRFRLGFANRTLGYRLPAKGRKAGDAVRGRLQRFGILRETGHEHFNGCLVIPIFAAASDGEEGSVVEIYGRKIGGRLRKGTELHLYLPGPHRGVWNREALVGSEEVILCESLIDALTFWCAGFRNVTSSYGVNGFTPEHLAALRDSEVRRVFLAYDSDEAGEKAAKALAKKLEAEGIGCYRVRFPRGMDVNEYALKVGPAEKSLDLVLRHAEAMGEAAVPVSAPSPSQQTAPKPAPATAAPAPSPSPRPAPMSPPAPTTPFQPPLPVAAASTSESATLLPAQQPTTSVPAEVREHEVRIVLGDRQYRVRGLGKNLSYDVLRVNLLVTRGEAFHVDTLNLYLAPKRASYVKQASRELGLSEELLKEDLGKVLVKLEELQCEQIESALRPKEPVIEIDPDDQHEALVHLEKAGLIDRTRQHLTEVGIVGEEINKLLLYLVATSRQLWRPLAVLLQSSSASGKSVLMEGVLSLMPEEERVSYSAMTGQSLYYMGEKDLRHKVLSIAEGEGMERASYALKLLQSEGKVSIASTGKDPATGRLKTHEYVVEGPASILTTSTQIDMDEEFQNRCLVLSVDESREQTEAIHRYQRQSETLEGLRARERRRRLQKLHQTAQRLLRPLAVINPFAERLRYPSTSTRTRRDHQKYLGLIRVIALLHQHQREVRREEVEGKSREVIEVELSDVELANELACEVLGRTLDELPPQTLALLELIQGHVKKRCGELEMEQQNYRFTCREIREVTGWGNSQLHMHLKRLGDLEYVLAHRGRRGQRYEYELLWNGEGVQGKPFVLGLLDPETLEKQSYDEKCPGSGGRFPGSIRPQSGTDPGPILGRESDGNRVSFQGVRKNSPTRSEKRTFKEEKQLAVVASRRSAKTREVGDASAS